MSARKIGLLLLIVGFGATIETAWHVRGDVNIGPEGCRVMGGRFYGPSWSFEQAAERALASGEAPRLEVENAFGGVSVTAGAAGVVKVRLRKVVFQPTEEKARAFAERVELRLIGRRRAGARQHEPRRDRPPARTWASRPTSRSRSRRDTAVEIRNEHGRVELSDVASGDVVSSFEGVSVDGISGDAQARSPATATSARATIGGALALNSRHGSVEVADVKGRVDARRAARRRLGPEDRAGSRSSVSTAGSRPTRVGGDLVVRPARSEVHASDVAAAPRSRPPSPPSSSRASAATPATRPARRGHRRGRGGRLVVETTRRSVDLDRVAARSARPSSTAGSRRTGLATGGPRARLRAETVALDGFAGPVEVEVERGSARLAPGGVRRLGVRLASRTARCTSRCPEGSRFDARRRVAPR